MSTINRQTRRITRWLDHMDWVQRVDESQRPDFAGYRPVAPLYECCNLQTVLDGLSPAKLPAVPTFADARFEWPKLQPL
jgi:hypothetical protein